VFKAHKVLLEFQVLQVHKDRKDLKVLQALHQQDLKEYKVLKDQQVYKALKVLQVHKDLKV
jgi:hypothetical protein